MECRMRRLGSGSVEAWAWVKRPAALRRGGRNDRKREARQSKMEVSAVFKIQLSCTSRFGAYSTTDIHEINIPSITSKHSKSLRYPWVQKETACLRTPRLARLTTSTRSRCIDAAINNKQKRQKNNEGNELHTRSDIMQKSIEAFRKENIWKRLTEALGAKVEGEE